MSESPSTSCSPSSCLDTCSSDDLAVVTDLAQRLVEVLRETVESVANELDIAVGVYSLRGVEWISQNDDCQCCRLPECSAAEIGVGHCRQRSSSTIPLTCQGLFFASVVVCAPRDRQAEAHAMHALIEAAARRIEAERQEESLLTELSASWESLEAVYEISTQLRTCQDPEKLLDQILQRAGSIQRGLQAELWIERNHQFEPVSRQHSGARTPRDPQSGLFGKALSERRAIVINNERRIETASILAPELRGAKAVLVAPTSTRRGLRVVLQLWQDQSGLEPFDTRTVHLAQAIALQAAMVVENDSLQRAALENERLRQEVEIGSKIHNTLLAGQQPKEMDGIDVAILTLPSRMVDGDFIEFFRHNDRCLDIIVGDVMGKGIPAALLGAATKSQFHHAMSYLLFLDNTRYPEPAVVVRKVHGEIAAQLIALESFVTVCYARIDLRSRNLIYVDCGHTRTIHYHQSSGECSFLQGDNMPLGFTQRETHRQEFVPFEEGDLFVFYSDGVTESKNSEGEYFGEERLTELIRLEHALSPKDLVQRIREEVSGFIQRGSFDDDLTCVVAKIDSLQGRPWTPMLELSIRSLTEELPKIRGFVRRACLEIANPPWCAERCNELEVALFEAAANVINHAYRGQSDRQLSFEGRVQDDRVVIYLKHDGEMFNPREVLLPEQDPLQDRGRGLYIISNFVEEVLYTRDQQGRNSIRLTKYRE